MGHVLDTYHSIQSLGLETIRSVYSKAGLSIRQKTKMSELDQLKQLAKLLGLDPKQVFSQSVLADGAITEKSVEDQQLSMLRKRLREIILAEKVV